MFDNISFSTFGRAVMGQKDWHIAESFGTNRLYYIHSGTVVFSGGDIKKELKPGSLYLFPQNIEFSLITDKDTEVDHTFFDFFMIPALKTDFVLEIDLEKSTLIKYAAKILIELAQAYPMIYPFLQRNEHYDVVKSYLKNLLIIINDEFKLTTITDERVNTALKFIHDNFYNKITVEELAELNHLEKNYFIKIFKNNLGVTPYQYIKNYRLNIAVVMLRSKKSVSEVADLVGYSDVSSFSNAIKKEFGIYPSDIK